MNRLPLYLCALSVLGGALLGGCSQNAPTVVGNHAIGSDSTAEAEAIARLAGATYIDLEGRTATESEIALMTTYLSAVGNTGAHRNYVIAGVQANQQADDYWANSERARLLGNASIDYYDRQLRLYQQLMATPGLPPAVIAQYQALIAQWTAQRDSLTTLGTLLNAHGMTHIALDSFLCNTLLFDDQNMGSTNLVNATFQFLLGRAPDPIELANGIAMCDGQQGMLFLTQASSASAYLRIVLDARLFRENQVRQVFRSAIGREPTPFELTSYTNDYETSGDYRAMQRAILASDAYFDRQSGAKRALVATR